MEFVKSGFSEKQALQLAEISSKFQNVADSEVEAGDAANFIISQMKAFKIEADGASRVIDVVETRWPHHKNTGLIAGTLSLKIRYGNQQPSLY